MWSSMPLLVLLRLDVIADFLMFKENFKRGPKKVSSTGPLDFFLNGCLGSRVRQINAPFPEINTTLLSGCSVIACAQPCLTWLETLGIGIAAAGQPAPRGRLI